jgi:hypothetical protein
MNPNIELKPLTFFLYVYFHILEQNLNCSENELKSIKFQSEEANTDEYLKKYFKEYMLKNNNIKATDLTLISVIVDNVEFSKEIKDLYNFKIINAFLPDEISENLKIKIAKSKNSVYTNPDLYLEISDGENLYYESVELKSTKNNNIPGSSVQQISPFEWVIFIKRDKDKVLVSTGFYINSITEKLPFPDRSPRPQVGFDTLSDWNKKYRKVDNKTLSIENISKLNEEKIKLLIDWQDYLASEWLEIIKSEKAKNNEKWFNNAIRKFAIKFLEYTESLDESQKETLKNNLNLLIK